MLREIAVGTPEFDRFIAALASADLPTEDLTSEPFRYFTVDNLASGGFGVGPDALLRSLVVAPPARGRGFGRRIAEGLVSQAREAGVDHLWLLTTGAADFFKSLNWREIDRAQAPEVITRSRQFSELCPASSILMVRTL